MTRSTQKSLFYQLLSGNTTPLNIVIDQSESSIPETCIMKNTA